MQRAATALVLFIVLSHSAWPDNLQGQFENDLAAIRTLSPRPEGSEASRRLVALLRDRLSQMRVPYRSLDSADSEDLQSFATSIVATIEGRRPDTVLLCVPIDSPGEPQPGRDGSLGTAIALEIARRAVASRPPLTIEILFLGAEQGSSDAYPISSRLFLREYYPEQPVLAVYLNLQALPRSIVVRAGSEGVVAPLWLVRRTLGALEGSGIETRIDGKELQLARAGLARVRTPIGPFLREGYPAIALEGDYDRAAAPGGEGAWARGFFDFWREFLETSRDGIPSTWDRHYLLVRAGEHMLVVSERSYLLLLVVMFAASVVYLQLARRRLSQDIVATGQHLWLLPILLLATYAFLLAGTGLVYMVQALRGVTDLWAAAPGLFLLLKIATAAFLLLLVGRLLPRFAILWMASIPPRFFPSAALLLLILGLILVGVADVSLAVIFMWPVLIVFVYAATRRTWLRLLALVLAPASTAIIGMSLVLHPGGDAGRFLVMAPVQGNLVLAVMLLPYVLLLLDLSLSAEAPWHIARFLRRVAPVPVGSSLAALLATALLFPPFGPERPQIVEVTRYVDLTASRSRIEISSSAALGTIRYAEGGVVHTVRTRARSRLLPAESPGELLQISTSGVAVLDRKNVTFSVQPQGSPESIEIAILSPERFVLFDSSFPATRDESGRIYSLHIGRYPPLPLSVDLTLPQGTRFTLAVRVTYENMPTSVELPGRYRVVRSRMIVDEGFDFRT